MILRNLITRQVWIAVQEQNKKQAMFKYVTVKVRSFHIDIKIKIFRVFIYNIYL
jgi:hypothetical protein